MNRPLLSLNRSVKISLLRACGALLLLILASMWMLACLVGLLFLPVPLVERCLRKLERETSS